MDLTCTLMQYLITISYQPFVPYVRTRFLGEIYAYYVNTFALWHEPSVCVRRL